MQPAAAAIASEAVAFQVIISFTDSIIGFFFFSFSVWYRGIYRDFDLIRGEAAIICF